MKNEKTVTKTDVVELMRSGPDGHNWIPEQERNFDAGYMPSETPRTFLREEMVDGKWYRVYQG